MPFIICKICGNERKVRPSLLLKGKGKFCSKKCFDIFQTGRDMSHKRKGIQKKCLICDNIFYCPPSRVESKKYCSLVCFGKRVIIVTKETREKISKSNIESRKVPPSAKGKKYSEEHRRKLGVRGEKNHNWKGGITPENEKVRNSFDYKEWRKKVFERDHYRCVECGNGNINKQRTPLQADHVKSFSQYPELRFDVDNGRTLCIPCHKETHSYLNRWQYYDKSIIATIGV